jgi:threonine dehydrogenase-like Zn-dependent dehydrogenase
MGRKREKTVILGAVVHAPGDVRVEERDTPKIIDPRTIDPGKVFDLTLPLDQAAEGYRAMDERRAIKTLLRP